MQTTREVVDITPSLRALSRPHAEPPAMQISAALCELMELFQARIIADSSRNHSVQAMLADFETRQAQLLESTLRQWKSEREAQAAEMQLRMAEMHLQAKLDASRVLRVMWLATGLAAAGAGIALALLS